MTVDGLYWVVLTLCGNVIVGGTLYYGNGWFCKLCMVMAGFVNCVWQWLVLHTVYDSV